MTTVNAGFAPYVLLQTSESSPGFLLLDSSLNPFGLNAEAVRVLSYAGEWGVGIDQFLNYARSRMFSAPIQSSPPPVRFRSGKRTYVCRVFPLKDGTNGSNASMILLLERESSPGRMLSRACKQFNFTERESNVAGCLVDGLTNKEIATQMHISVNTVRTFLRLIMIKMGVTTRSGVVGRLMSLRPE